MGFQQLTAKVETTSLAAKIDFANDDEGSFLDFFEPVKRSVRACQKYQFNSDTPCIGIGQLWRLAIS